MAKTKRKLMLLADFCERLGVSQRDLAKLNGVSDMAVSKWVNGRCLVDVAGDGSSFHLVKVQTDDYGTEYKLRVRELNFDGVE